MVLVTFPSAGGGGALWKISKLSLNSRVAKSVAQGEASVTVSQAGGITHNEILCTGKAVSTLNRKSQTPVFEITGSVG